MSGYPEMVDSFGPLLSYELAPRAKIFRRDQGTVVDMKSMQAIMRYNGMYLDEINNWLHSSVLVRSGQTNRIMSQIVWAE